MGEIIQFPEKRSNGYYNLVALFKICDNVASCNAYLDIAETLFENGDFKRHSHNRLYVYNTARAILVN